MSIFLDRFNVAPLYSDEFSDGFAAWLAILTNQLNDLVAELQDQLNGISDGLILPPKTQAEILVLGIDAEEGTAWYAVDAVPPNVVIKINGALRQLDTSAFP